MVSLEIDRNGSEVAIKPFIIGRKELNNSVFEFKPQYKVTLYWGYFAYNFKM